MLFLFSPPLDVFCEGQLDSLMFKLWSVNGASVVNVVPQNERTRFLFLKSYARCISVPTCFLLLPESLGPNLERIRLSLKRFLLIGLSSLTLVFN